MARYIISATFTLDTDRDSDERLIRNEAETLLRNTAQRRSSQGYNGVSVTLGEVTVERAPDPEPVISMTRSELEAHIAACVAEAVAAQQNAG